MARYIYQVHIADGFGDDCEKLVQRCSENEPVTYQKFVKIWKDMNFHTIYKYRTMGAEIAELSEELLHVAKHYMVTNTSSFEESVAGLFLVYALLNVQPYAGFATLKIVPEDVPAIHRIELVARRERRVDVLYILGCVLIAGPVQYTAAAREYGMDTSLRKYLEGCTSIDSLGISARPKGVFYKQNEELDILKELNSLTKSYEEAKAKITDVRGRKDASLCYADKNLASELDASLRFLVSGKYEKHDNGTMDIADRSEKVHAIKQKAMKNNIDSMVRYTTVEERQKKKPGLESSPGSSVKKDITTKAGKVKISSPTKPISNSPRKRSRTEKKQKGKKTTKKTGRKQIDSTSSDSSIESDIINFLHGKTVAKEINAEDLKLDEVAAGTVEENVECDKTNKPEEGEVVVDVEIDSLPILIRNNVSDGIEIELINEPSTSKYNASNNNASQVNIEEEKSKKEIIKEAMFKLMPEVSLTKVKDTSPTDRPTDRRVYDTAAEIIKKPQNYKLRKRDKRELKKPILKSKFKKMGLEPVANFKDSNKSDAPE